MYVSGRGSKLNAACLVWAVVANVFGLKGEIHVDESFSLPSVPATLFSAQMDAVSRTCRVTGVGGGQKVIIECSFPEGYPNNAAPSFNIIHTTLDAAMRSRLLKVAHAHSVMWGESCSQCDVGWKLFTV